MQHLPNLQERFESVLILRARRVDSLGVQVPKTLTF